MLQGSVQAGDLLDIEFWTTDAKMDFLGLLELRRELRISKDM
jgi:hypothetical protein